MARQGLIGVRATAELPAGRRVLQAKFAEGKIHKTIELEENTQVDVDRRGKLLGIEIIEGYKPGAKLVHLRKMLRLDRIRAAVEAGLSRTVETEFRALEAAIV